MKISSSLIKVGMCAIASSLIVVALAGKDAPTTEKTAIEKRASCKYPVSLLGRFSKVLVQCWPQWNNSKEFIPKP